MSKFNKILDTVDDAWLIERLDDQFFKYVKTENLDITNNYLFHSQARKWIKEHYNVQAVFQHNGNTKLIFESEEHYTMCLLKWS